MCIQGAKWTKRVFSNEKNQKMHLGMSSVSSEKKAAWKGETVCCIWWLVHARCKAKEMPLTVWFANNGIASRMHPHHMISLITVALDSQHISIPCHPSSTFGTLICAAQPFPPRGWHGKQIRVIPEGERAALLHDGQGGVPKVPPLMLAPIGVCSSVGGASGF